VLRRILSWSVANELAAASPAEGIPELYSNDRSVQIAEPQELAAVLAAVTAGFLLYPLRSRLGPTQRRPAQAAVVAHQRHLDRDAD